MPRQHQRPIGPTTNTAAPFIPAMVTGSGPPPRSPIRASWLPPDIGCQVAQPTHVPAPFNQDMVAGAKPPSPVLFSTRGIFGAQLLNQTTPVAAPFSPDMVAGARLDRNRELLPARPGWHSSQVTHVDAPFGSEMVDGWQPDRNRELLPLKIGWAISQPTPTPATFGLEMVAGSGPGRNREVFPLRLGQQLWISDLVSLSPDMTQGWHPDSPRLLLGARLALPVSQPTHVSAGISPEMFAGSQPIRFRECLPLRTGATVWSPEVVGFSIDMVIGWHPDAPRLFLAPRIALPVSQSTPVAAPFSHDMIAVQQPVRSRDWVPLRTGVTLWTPEVVSFSIDMVIGSHPDAPRLLLASRIPLPVSQVTHVAAAFGLEMVSGWRPDQPRPYVPPHAGLALSQTTHVEARFSVEMTTGWLPTASRGFAVHPTPPAIPPDVQIFSIEMVLCTRPERPRIVLAPRIPLPLAQPTPVAAPFTPDMILGWRPFAPPMGRRLSSSLRMWPHVYCPEVTTDGRFRAVIARSAVTTPTAWALRLSMVRRALTVPVASRPPRTLVSATSRRGLDLAQVTAVVVAGHFPAGVHQTAVRIVASA